MGVCLRIVSVEGDRFPKSQETPEARTRAATGGGGGSAKAPALLFPDLVLVSRVGSLGERPPSCSTFMVGVLCCHAQGAAQSSPALSKTDRKGANLRSVSVSSHPSADLHFPSLTTLYGDQSLSAEKQTEFETG